MDWKNDNRNNPNAKGKPRMLDMVEALERAEAEAMKATHGLRPSDFTFWNYVQRAYEGLVNNVLESSNSSIYSNGETSPNKV